MNRNRFLCLLLLPALLPAQQAAVPSPQPDEQLKLVVFLTRHGVRSPTSTNQRYDPYSAAPWPNWSVPPGHLTAHGFELMKLFGAYDRASLAASGLLSASGCEAADGVTIRADSDQRTRETGRALAEGMFPGCAVKVQALPEGTVDSLFESKPEEERHAQQSFALAAVAGRTGGDSANLTEAYRPQLLALDKILAGCGKTFAAINPSRVSIFDAPAGKTQGDFRRALLPGPLALSSTLTENLLLEFAEGMNGAELGWGCLDEPTLRHVMQLHTAATEYAKRTPAVARAGATNLLGAILGALRQSATDKVVAGAPGKPGDHVLFLVGHDTNIAMASGVLHLNWVIDGRADDTPPGGSLVFELWRARKDGAYSVRVYYTAQTLQQMRAETALTVADPPQRVPVFVPGCSDEHMVCTLDAFAATVSNAVAQR